jgi:hypothetical protein
MARTIRTIEAVTSSAAMEVDRDEGIIRGVKILGLVSDNNRKYLPEAVRKAKSLYEGIKVNINHPAESGDVRNAEDRFGKLINVKYVEGEGLYGDLMFLKSHPMAERICEAAERNDMNDTFGLSHNAQGDGQEDDQGCFVVSSIVEVRHVDLVADPATTKSLREARTRMKANNRSIKEAEEKLTKLQIHSRRMKNDPAFRAAQQKMSRDAEAETAAQIMAQKKREREGGGYQAEIFLNGRPYKDSRILKSKAEAEKYGKMYEKEESDVGQKYTYKVKKVDVYGYTVKESDGQEEEPIADEEMAEASNQSVYPPKLLDLLKQIATSNASPQHKKSAIDALIKQYESKLKESDGQEGEDMDDEKEIMTEATNFDDKQLDWIRKNVYDASKMGKVKTLAKTAQAAISEINKWLMGANQNHSGPKTAATFGHYRDALTSVPVNSTLSDLANLDPSKYINNDAFSESKMREAEDVDDEDEMMTEADDMPVDDPSEEEMTEAGDSGKQEYAAKVKPLVQKADSLASEARQKLHDASVIVSNLSSHVSGKQLKKYLNSIANLLSDSKQKCFDAEKFLSAAASGNWDIDESINDEDEMMPKADDMPVEDPSEEEMTEAISLPDKQEARDFINQSSLALHKLMKMLKGVEADEDSAKAKQAIKTIGSTTDKIIKELSSLDAQLQAASAIKESEDDTEDDMPMDETDDELAIEAEDDYTEEEYSDDEDKMAMESKRRLQQFCKTNGVVLTEGLLKDLKPLTEAAQKRCILRIKLASKARKPKSSGSMMPMTESKVHTGDNVFNWLRS